MKPKLLEERPPVKHQLPNELVNDVLGAIRRQFVPELTEKEWFRDHNHFIKVKVVLWPARQMVQKGFTIPPERYKGMLLEILQEVKRHGQTGAVRYWPGYLMKCVQEHWAHHWEEYYAEAKAVRNRAEAALLAMKGAQGDKSAQVVEALATAHRLLAGKKQRQKKAPVTQGELGI